MTQSCFNLLLYFQFCIVWSYDIIDDRSMTNQWQKNCSILSWLVCQWPINWLPIDLLIDVTYIYKWQRSPILPRSAGAGACDRVNVMQSNTVLCMVLLQKQKLISYVWCIVLVSIFYPPFLELCLVHRTGCKQIIFLFWKLCMLTDNLLNFGRHVSDLGLLGIFFLNS